mmetsp:Transcript_19988/g.46107  ORF Transcript_19988/g.46107 Transcript_19988/m.46107 type:complete len:286 (-) Transcript_19988:526-1383(-)
MPGLTITTSVLDFDAEGRIPLSSRIKHVVLEIGCNGHNLLWNQRLRLPFDVPGLRQGWPLSNQSEVLLISFEPLWDKYALYLSHHRTNMLDGGKHARRTTEKSYPPGWAVRSGTRHIVLPMAVGHPDGEATLHVARSDGCSSLLPINLSAASGEWRSWGFMRQRCAKQADTRTVPLISLQTVIERWLPRKLRVSFVKIDAQGYDAQVAASAGRAAARIDAFQLEVSSDACAQPYNGAETCTASVARLRAMGFDTLSQCARPHTWHNRGFHDCSGDIFFYRKVISS